MSTRKSQYGWLTVKKRLGNGWCTVRCKCGKTLSVPSYRLRTSNSCGCLKRQTSRMNAQRRRVDLTGEVFGLYRVLMEAEYNSARKCSMWRCECVLCGKTSVVRVDTLTSGRSNGCLGCVRKSAKTAEAECRTPVEPVF